MMLGIIVCFSVHFFSNKNNRSFLAATQFHHFFSFPEMMPVTKHFTIYHINAPGQEDQANPLPSA
jgi:hypothetical protein